MLDRLRGDRSPRVAVIGLEGVPYSLLSAHPDRFEHFSAVFDEGVAAPATGVVPPDTSASWPALTTGKNPGETGVYGLLDREIHSYNTYVTAGDDVQSRHLWDHVADADRQVSLVNVPMTYPPQRNLQRVVAGYPAPDLRRACYPRRLARQLRPLDYRIDVEASIEAVDNPQGFLEDAYETLDARFEAFSRFIDADDWDLFFGVFIAPDRVNHFLFGEYLDGTDAREDFLSFYEQLDTYIGALRSRLPDDTTLVLVSGHGFTRLDRVAQVNAFLRDEGWLSFASEPATELADIAPESRAYSLAPGRIYLNLEDREPAGSVPQTAYEVVRRDLEETLTSWTTPDGRPVIDRVFTREERYRGPHVDLAPDLVILPTEGIDLKAGFGPNVTQFESTTRTGTHQVDDCVMAIDRADATLDDASLYDIAPTVFSLLDLEFDRAAFDGASRV